MEIVSLRVSAVGLLPKAEGKAAPVHSERKPARHRKVWTAGAWREKVSAQLLTRVREEMKKKGFDF